MELRTAGVCSNLVDDDDAVDGDDDAALPHGGVRQSAREAARVDEVRVQLLWDSWCDVEREATGATPETRPTTSVACNPGSWAGVPCRRAEMGCMRRQWRETTTEAARQQHRMCL
jgi:hypothetical protein